MARKKAATERQERSKPESPAILQAPLAELPNGGDAAKPPGGYLDLLEDLKTQIRSSQLRATVAVNRELVLLYWSIGRQILSRQHQKGWGTQAREIIKDPYRFDFLSLGPEAHERDLEQGLIDHIQRFLLELGVGFAFVGRQFPVDVSGESFYLDLLFYHLELRCFVVIDLKSGEFRPEDAGKMNFYLSAVDDLLRHPDDQPSIGLILCRTKRRLVVEYALRDLNKPVGVSSYELKILESLPDELKGRLPTIEELEDELGNKE